MAMEPGGRADKLGNDYESLFVVMQMLRVVAEEAEAILLEGQGDDEKGVDLWVSSSGLKLGLQCKRENEQEGKWTVSSLRSVLVNSKFQLDRGQDYRFEFVSSDPVPTLNDLAERTQRCDNDFSQFVNHQLTSQKHEKCFETYCKVLSLNSSKPHDQKAAFDLLARTRFVLFRRPDQSRSEVERLARLFVDGDPGTTLSVLKDFSLENIGNLLAGARILEHLRSKGLEPTRLSKGPSLTHAIECVRKRFTSSIIPLMIGGEEFIPREESKSVLNSLEDPEGPRVTILHGDAGVGKSGVLFEIVQVLKSKGKVVLPVRLDRQQLKVSTKRFGREECDLPASPANCLRPYQDDDLVVLVIDQLDAIRWTSSHSAGAMVLFGELVEEALAIANCRILVACRTFDLKDNQLIWQRHSEAVEAVVKPLPIKDVQQQVRNMGGVPGRLTSAQLAFLQNVQNLYLWTQIRTDGDFVYDFDNPTDLLRVFWVWIRKAFEEQNLPVAELNAFLTSAVDYMSKSGRRTYPAVLAQQSAPKTIEKLMSLTVIRKSDSGDLVFSHQSHYDYLLAETIANDIRTGETTIHSWLMKNRQTLFCREQLRLILANLRETDDISYQKAFATLLHRDGIRFHLRQLTLAFFASVKSPSELELNEVNTLLDSDLKSHVLDTVLHNNPTWMRLS